MILIACIPLLVRCMAVLSLLLFMGIVCLVGCFCGGGLFVVGSWYGGLFGFVLWGCAVCFVGVGCWYRGRGKIG